MKFRITSLVIWISLIGMLFTGCGGDTDHQLTFSELISRADKYNGQSVTLEAFYFTGFEIAVICESVEPSKYDNERLVPHGAMVWVERGVSEEIYNRMYIQNKTPSGYVEHIAKLKITGNFETGGKYGHMNAYQYKINFTAVELLEWAP